jgi:hypothetical protein
MVQAHRMSSSKGIQGSPVTRIDLAASDWSDSLFRIG